jgi:sulfur transfer complex TusBCD TusB component (DsrH family)
MLLHTVNLLPADARCLDCIAQLAPADAVLFLGRGLHWAGAGDDRLAPWHASGARLFALREELAALGLADATSEAGHSAGVIQLIAQDDFLSLVLECTAQRAWF